MSYKARVLCIDDEPGVVELVNLILKSQNIQVIGAHSGKEGLEIMRKDPPDAVLLDIMMPEMDGLEVLTKLKGVSDTTSIPVILLTAKVQYEDVLGGYKLGADYYITKPFTSTQLINGINLLLGERKS